MDQEAAEIASWLRLFLEPGQVTELRALDVQEGNWSKTMAGYFDFDHVDDMAREAWRLSQNAVGTYFIPNPVDPALLARCANRVKQARKDEQVADKNIVRRKWLLVDADPVRPDGISSTDEEKAHAWDAILQARSLCEQWGFPHWVLADSGNGYHLLIRVEWLADKGRDLGRRILNELGDQLDTDAVKIDRKVFNAARIVKLYGTLSRKGDDAPDIGRLHRVSRVIEAKL